MIYYNPDSEDAAVEQPTINLVAEFGWTALNRGSSQTMATERGVKSKLRKVEP